MIEATEQGRVLIKGALVSRAYMTECDGNEPWERFLEERFGARWTDHDEVEFPSTAAALVFKLRYATGSDFESKGVNHG